MITYIRKLFTSLIFGFPPPKISDISFKKRNYKWCLKKGKLYKVKENVSFAIHLYDMDKCLYKTNTVHSIKHNMFGGDILMYIEDVYVSEEAGGDKIYHRPLFLIGEQLFVPRHDMLFNHNQKRKKFYASDVVHSFNEVLEEVK